MTKKRSGLRALVEVEAAIYGIKGRVNYLFTQTRLIGEEGGGRRKFGQVCEHMSTACLLLLFSFAFALALYLLLNDCDRN